MSSVFSRRLRLCATAAAALVFSACQSGPKPPQPGTPAFNWLAAKDAYRSGDVVKANNLLVQLARTENEFTAKAQPWALATSQGLANAYMVMADQFDDGAKKNRSNPTPFRKLASSYKARATEAALQYAEVADRFLRANKANDVAIAVEFPAGPFDDPQQFKKISSGQMIPDAEVAVVEKAVIRTQLAKALGRMVGEAKDLEKARAAFPGGEAKASGPVVVMSVASGLFSVSEIFGPKKLDQPQRIKVLYDEASEALALIPDNKDGKDLAKKIADGRKKAKLS